MEALETAVADSIARAEPSVVTVLRSRNPGGTETLAVRGRNGLGQAGERFAMEAADLSEPSFIPLPGDYGAGVVVGEQNEILTTFHNVQGASRIHVRAPGQASFDAEVIAADPRSDLAVIVPRPQPGQRIPKLPPLPLGDADRLRKGSFLTRAWESLPGCA